MTDLSAGGVKVLVVGGGAREHALGAALAGAPDESGRTLLFAPGNAGTSALGRCFPIAIDDVAGLVALATRERVDLVVVGPELPLTLGLVDALEAAKIPAFGPSKAAARLEGSKAFMKRFLRRHGIVTAAFEVFDDADAAAAYIRAAGRPLVVKTDGLAAGKGVVVAADTTEALVAVDRMMRERVFGDAGATVVIEDFLPGEEASFHVICDGTRAVALAPAQDHKRVFDGDRGPNTGGMGAYAPAPIVTPAVHEKVMRTIVEPTLRGMAAEGAPFRGVLFVGLMIEAGEPRVLEFNVRFGDPEACVILPLMERDLLALLGGAARGDLTSVAPNANVAPTRAAGAALCVVMAAHGYPAAVRSGDAVRGLDAPIPSGAFVRHAGTARDAAGAVVTSGGRVLAVGARAPTLAAASSAAYEAVAQIRWAGEHHRMDIGHRAK